MPTHAGHVPMHASRMRIGAPTYIDSCPPYDTGPHSQAHQRAALLLRALAAVGPTWLPRTPPVQRRGAVRATCRRIHCLLVRPLWYCGTVQRVNRATGQPAR